MRTTIHVVSRREFWPYSMGIRRARRPGHGTDAAPVRFLPYWDATVLVHARRTQVLVDGSRWVRHR